ncbi:MAG: glycosyltransferase [Candidatus Paracaedibacteraceae bacterium]|nr:glycosyltransferase [Candidatus Paracaedibacteraceae bacterium]
MKNFVKEMIRYAKLPFKFVYWITGLFLFVLSVGYLYCKKNNQKKFNKYEKSVVCVSHVAISFDGRIKKCANQIKLLGLPVTLIKPYDAQEDKEFEFSGLDSNVQIKRVGLSGSFSHFPCMFDFLMVMYLVFCKSKFIHCHDVNTAFMGLLASNLTGKVLISDLHEWKSETSNVDAKKQNLFQIKILKLIENLIVKKSNFVITVNKVIADELKKGARKEREIFIVKNCPTPPKLQSYNLKLNLNIPKEQVVGYYVGQMAPYRNIAQLIKAIKKIPNLSLVFQGTIDASYLNILKNICETENISERVFFLPPIPHDFIPSACQGADFGIFSCSVNSKSMRSALPNKLFEYIAGGIPIFSEDIPLMRQYIEECEIGSTFQSDNIDTICESLKLMLDHHALSCMKRNVLSLKEKLVYETNSENSSVYATIYGS